LSLQHRPRILFLDEPTAGHALDVVAFGPIDFLFYHQASSFRAWWIQLDFRGYPVSHRDALLIPSHTTKEGWERNFQNRLEYDEVGVSTKRMRQQK
jgi:hypothetical protein